MATARLIKRMVPLQKDTVTGLLETDGIPQQEIDDKLIYPAAELSRTDGPVDNIVQATRKACDVEIDNLKIKLKKHPQVLARLIESADTTVKEVKRLAFSFVEQDRQVKEASGFKRLNKVPQAKSKDGGEGETIEL